MSKYAKQVKLVFDDNDVESCELCIKLNGKLLNLKDVPELPFRDCTSESGCKFRLETMFDDNFVYLEGDELDDDESEADEEGSDNYDAVAKLEQLKKMLNNGLITEEDYQKKKNEILSRM